MDEDPKKVEQQSDYAKAAKVTEAALVVERPAKLEEQLSSTTVDPVKPYDYKSNTADKVKWEHDLFRDVLANVNQTLRFQISLAVPVLAACVTVLNIVPPQAHQELLNELDRWVFIPALLSIGIGYRGLEKHLYTGKKFSETIDDIENLYGLIDFKNNTVRAVIALQALALVLMMTFVLLEYK